MEPFIGQIIMFGGNFAPRGWAFCEGQLLAVSQNTALFSILGTTYGGDGRTTFALPDLRGRTPIGPGTGPGLSTHRLGQRGGSQTNTLTLLNLPSHSHSAAGTVKAYFAPPIGGGETNNPTGANFSGPAGGTNVYSGSEANANMATNNVSVTVGATGGGQSFSIMQPFECVYFIIALMGIYPSRN